jgi:hypothetical protein
MESDLDLSNPLLLDIYFDGLNTNVQNEIAKMERPLTLQELIDLSIRIDNNLHHQKLRSSSFKNPSGYSYFNQEYRSQNKINHITSRKHTHEEPYTQEFPYSVDPGHDDTVLPDGEPMELDAINSSYRRISPLTPAQKEELRKKNACFKCRKPGHRAFNCPSLYSSTHGYSSQE